MKMSAGALKKTTNLTGLLVAKNPHHVLGVLYSKILRVLQKVPKEAAYRKYTEEVIAERAQIIKSNPDVTAIERQIGCGQIEELIVQAENELILAKRMVTWKAWKPLVEKAPQDQWKWPPVK